MNAAVEATRAGEALKDVVRSLTAMVAGDKTGRETTTPPRTLKAAERAGLALASHTTGREALPPEGRFREF